MRIIAGEFGSLKIQAVAGEGTRPTLDKTKEAIFSMIEPIVNDGNVLDLYAGSGALGIEAVSRGLRHAFLVDKSREAYRTIKVNVLTTKHPERFTIIHASANLFLDSNQEKFSLVFLDPPYAKQQIANDINKLNDSLEPDALIVVESSRDVDLSGISESFELIKEKDYRDTKIRVLKYKEIDDD
jgi:16S rRNA (guanine(966)-N(2))-methyltransferase RsmD